ncbi:hypothetical protein ACFC58_06985 [Kitasatospora purpeofusca]|uniref:hypothetical protein n=1 Tax=Kitasatospora purpeofusca TaxID=67352 RepID=UPI0035E162C6
MTSSIDTRPQPAPTGTPGARLLADGLQVLARHERASRQTLNLVPAENAMAPAARLPQCADLAGRYMFDQSPDPAAAQWRFAGARDAQWLETGLAVPLLQRLLGAAHVNVRPLSGLQAMEMTLAAYPACAPVALLSPDQGGHYATADIARRLGQHVLTVTGPDPYRLDLARLADLCAAKRPALLYIDQCHALVPYDIAAISATVKNASPTTVVHADISHLLGLVLGGAVANPLACGADSVSASTHKSFPGPQKGILATNAPGIANSWRLVQPQLISSHHFGSVAALGLALASFADRAHDYAHTVVASARSLGEHLASAGWDVAGADIGHTRTHQLWVTTTPRLPAEAAAQRLYAAGIRVNWLDDLPLGHPALRLGVAEAVWRGLSTADMPHLARLIDQALTGAREPAAVAADVAALPTEAYPFAARPDTAATGTLTEITALLLGREAGEY